VDNIVATLPGRDPTGAVVLVAHYDSVAAGPGASDDGAAVAAMLETIRAVRVGGPLRNDLVLLIADGEEAGLLGADAFVRSNSLAGQRAVVLNWEAGALVARR
jgi:Zn-dependent M28 family amino/carboxypeptidase